ncbi:LCP family glycopolymer transferase [Agromyces arachidis]|uniref:LCP family glycopolymer transferase n=1 Tax=Agromyces arachidis TaxID=766966 RepID=UPI00405763E3
MGDREPGPHDEAEHEDATAETTGGAASDERADRGEPAPDDPLPDEPAADEPVPDESAPDEPAADEPAPEATADASSDVGLPPPPAEGGMAAPVLGDARVPPARHGRLTRRSAAKAVAKGLGAAVAIAAISATAVGAYAVGNLVREVQPGVVFESEEILADVPDIGAMEGGLNFLLVGSDKRPADGSFGDPELDSAELNDVTMLLHISQDHSHVEVVSFPRDMLVDVPECADPEDPANTLSAGYGVKLNQVLSWGGLSCVGRTIEELTGVSIPVGGIVQFKGVAALSEAVGGVEVCLVDPIDDARSGLQLEAGRHTISGYTALAFLRTRHAVGDGSDLGRISSQQTFLASLARTLQSSGTLGDPVKLYGIAQVVLQNMTLSTSLQDPVRLVTIARTLQDVDLEKIAFIQYPTAYTWDSSAVEPTASAEIVNRALQADEPVVFDPNATSDASYGTVAADPTTTDAATMPPASDPAATPGATAPATTAPAEQLPQDVTGLTADEERCTTANPG